MTEETNSPTNDGAGAEGGAGGGGGTPWYAALPEDIRGNATLTRYTNLEDAARGLISANGRLRVPPERLLEVPEKPDDAAAMDMFWNKVGRPEKPDGYDLKDSKLQGDDSDAFKAFLATMHKAGPMTPAMARAAEDWYANYGSQVSQKATQALQAHRESSATALRSEWGDAYETRMNAAAEAAMKFGGAELKAYLDETGMGDDPRMVKAWAAVAAESAEAGAPPHDRGRDGPRPMTPAEATAELARLQTDPNTSKALQDKNHPQHAYWVQKRLDLFKAKRGGG